MLNDGTVDTNPYTVLPWSVLRVMVLLMGVCILSQDQLSTSVEGLVCLYMRLSTLFSSIPSVLDMSSNDNGEYLFFDANAQPEDAALESIFAVCTLLQSIDILR